MKVIADLIEAYSEHMGLPLFLSNLNGEIELKKDRHQLLLPMYDSVTTFLELKSVAQQISKPTIISVLEEFYQSDIFYIITPIFKVNNSKRFLIAGPFLLASKCEKNLSTQDKWHISTLNDEDVEEKINHMKNLYHLLISKEEIDTSFSVPEQIINVLEKLGDIEQDIVDYDEYISSILYDLLQIEAFDFLGIALRNEDDVFVIKHICGDKVQHLKNEKFYIGEGLLGKAVILGKDFYWSKKIDSKRTEFFNRLGVFSEHLFGMVFKQDEVVNVVIFGGSFKDTMISENLLKVLKFIFYLIHQKKKINMKLIDSYYLQSIFANWLDLMDIIVNVKDRKHICYKILDFCQTLNNGKFACFTTIHDDFIYRGNKRDDIVQLHQNQLADALKEQRSKLWINHHYVHFSLEFDFHIYGFFTVEFEENTDFQQITYIFNMVKNLLRQNYNVSLNNESIFDLLHTSMQEMNSHQYYLSNLSMNFAKKIIDVFQLSNNNKKLIMNICKVLPYRFEYLKKHICHTKEWKLLQETQALIQGNGYIDEDRLEVKILAYTYMTIIQRENKENIRFLNGELKEIFTEIYDSLLTEYDYKKEEIELKQIEELTDLKSVISTLAITSREKEILHLILEGLNNQEVADYLKISVHTVKNHITNIFKKLNVSDRIQAMAKIYRIKYGEL